LEVKQVHLGSQLRKEMSITDVKINPLASHPIKLQEKLLDPSRVDVDKARNSKPPDQCVSAKNKATEGRIEKSARDVRQRYEKAMSVKL
jgi:hypothetical protein